MSKTRHLILLFLTMLALVAGACSSQASVSPATTAAAPVVSAAGDKQVAVATVNGSGAVYADVAVMDNFSDGEPQPVADTVTFADTIPGSRAFVALVRDGQKILAYVCDAGTVSDWFRGEVQNETADLVSRGGARLQVTFAGATAGGTFTPAGGHALAFSAGPVAAPAGLYRSEGTVEGTDYVGGLIVLADGQYRGLVQSGLQLFIVDPDPLDIQDGSSNTLANVNWGDGLRALSFSQVGITP